MAGIVKRRLWGGRTSRQRWIAAAQSSHGFSWGCRIRFASDLLCKLFHGIPDGTATWELFLFEYPDMARAPVASEVTITEAGTQALYNLPRDSNRYICGRTRWEAVLPPALPRKTLNQFGLFLVTPLTCLRM